MSRKFPLWLLTGLVVLPALPAQGGIQWQTFSLSYLKGEHYKVGDPERQVLTFEHAANGSWGDSFLFWDHMWWSNGGESDYGEWSPRFSACKLWDQCLDQDGSLLKDWLIATTVERGEDFTNFLYGLGLDFKLPGFKYFTANVYRRMAEFKQDNWMITLTWGVPFQIGNQSFLYDGFIDWFNSTDDETANANWTAQLKWNLGKNFRLENPLYLGIEHTHWPDKYGIKDSRNFRTDESNINLLVKWHF